VYENYNLIHYIYIYNITYLNYIIDNITNNALQVTTIITNNYHSNNRSIIVNTLYNLVILLLIYYSCILQNYYSNKLF